ncbi:hypothetical protein [Methanobrevibacter sp.]
MDKKWIGIIIILIAGLCAMSYIVINSNTVGNALTVIDDVSVTLPPGYKILKTHTNDATLVTEDTSNNNTIFIKCMAHKDTTSDVFKKQLKSIKNNGEFEIEKDSDNTIQYKNVTSGQSTTVKIFEKENRTLYMKLSGFTDQKVLEKDSNFIIDNLKHDFKQNAK